MIPRRTRGSKGTFLTAPAIFPNNDIKCEVNKIRAQIYAAETRQAIPWSSAKVNPGNRVLAEKINLEEEMCGSVRRTAVGGS